MLKVNDKDYEWHTNMTVYNLFINMGYTLKKPSVLIKVNNEVVQRTNWDNFIIPEDAEILVVNLLKGG